MNSQHNILTFLGTGTSTGVPVLGCKCKVCQSTDPRDHRFRTAALVESDNTRLLIDAGPDIRQQLMPVEYRQINGVLLTHDHYDHVGGLDDLRPYCWIADVDVYADQHTAATLMRNMPYSFPGSKGSMYPGVPKFNLHTIEPHQPLHIGDFKILPFTVMHDKLPILGYRIGENLTYITDMKTIPESEVPLLRGTRTLVINALRWQKPHHSHQLVTDAIAFAHRIGARHTYLVHVTHDIGLYDEAQARLPHDVTLAYDGMKINF